MQKPRLHPQENERIEELNLLQILDSEGDKFIDEITKIASFIIQSKIALVSLVDTDRQWFFSKHGLQASETPRDISFCGHAILQDEIFIVEDSSKDERFFDNPLATGAPNVIFYAGIPIKVRDGLPIGTLCTIDDVPKKLSNDQISMLKTLASQVSIYFEKKRSDRLNQLENIRFRNIISGAQLGSWDWWLETNKVLFDEKWCEMLGLDHEKIEMDLSTWDSRVHPEDKEKCFEDIKNYLEGKTPYYQNIHRIKHESGGWVWILDKGIISEYSKAGKAIRFTGSHLDITVEKKEELLKSKIFDIKEKYIEHNKDKQAFFNFVNDLLIKETESEYAFIGEIKLDNKGHEFLKTYALTDISWNDETRKFYKENAPRGLEFKNLDTLFGEVIKSKKYLLTNEAPKHPKAKGIPFGHPPLLKFLGIPFFHENKMIAMIGLANAKAGYSEKMMMELSPIINLLSELTHYHILEQELKNKNSQIQHNAKLVSLGTLAAGIGHEINNPLTIASLITRKFIKKGINQEEIQVDLQKLGSALERISNIVKGLKSFSRNDHILEFKEFNMIDLINESVLMLKEIFLKQNINMTLDVKLDNTSHTIMGNRGKIQQVLINILNNAKDALEVTVSPKIEITIEESENDLLLIIQDNGPGIPEELLDKIFDPFFTTKDIQKGTGIGLSISQEIIQEHHGEISVWADSNQGATFKIRLPKNKISKDQR